jgi:hypothetical protein
MDGPSLSIRIDPSPRLCVLLCWLHLAAMLAPWATSLPAGARLAASGLALACLAGMLRAHFRPPASCRLRLRAGGWSLEENGCEVPVQVLPDTVVWEHLVVLRLRCGKRSRSRALLEDSCGAQDFRRLRAALRLIPSLSPGRSA